MISPVGFSGLRFEMNRGKSLFLAEKQIKKNTPKPLAAYMTSYNEDKHWITLSQPFNLDKKTKLKLDAFEKQYAEHLSKFIKENESSTLYSWDGFPLKAVKVVKDHHKSLKRFLCIEPNKQGQFKIPY